MNESSAPTYGRVASPQVEFNHLYVTLERETVDAIRKSKYVAKQFSVHSTTVEADEESWTGVFVLGQRAYIEIFPPGGAEGLIEGYSGTAFSTRRLGQIDEIEKRLQKVAPERAQRNLRVRKTDEGEVPWFHYLNLESSETKAFAAWLIDIHPGYFPWRGIDVPSDGRFSRSAYLKASGVAKSTPADDIVEIYLELTPEEQANLDLILGTLEFSSTDIASRIEYGSDKFKLLVSVLPDPNYRIRRVICTATQSESRPSELRFGPDARLIAEGESLVWEFGPESRDGSHSGLREVPFQN